MLKYLFLGVAGLFLLSRRSNAAPIPPKYSVGVVGGAVQPVSVGTPKRNATIPPINTKVDTLTLATKAAQLASSATSTSSAVYTAATAGTAGWSASLGVAGIPLAAKSIYDLTGASGPELGTDAISFFRNRANSAVSLLDRAKLGDKTTISHYSGKIIPWGGRYQANPKDKTAQDSAITNLTHRFKYWSDLTSAYDAGGYNAIAENPTLLKRAQTEWGNYVGANTGY